MSHFNWRSRARRLLLALVVLSASPMVVAADFAGAGGPIPDNNVSGLNVQFSVSGISRPVGRVRVGVNLTHSYIGDLKLILISPGGVARLIIFSRAAYKRTGTAFGAAANLAGNYVFDDAASSDLWTTLTPLADTAVVPPGTYRTSTGGQPGLSDVGGCSTFLTLAFGGLSGAQVNGTWTLHVADLNSSDSGSVVSALLTIDEESALFASGFEDSPAGYGLPGLSKQCRKPLVDFTGTGLSSYVTVRNTGGGPEGAMTWSVKNNDGSIVGTTNNFVHGIASDILLDGDFDGDGIADATVWRFATGSFLIRRSSRPSDAIQTIFLGQFGDRPHLIGDYDGDGIADAAVYRNGAGIDFPSSTLVRLSQSGELRTLTTGETGTFATGGVDFDGNAQVDVAMQSNAGGGAARFRIYSGVTGAIYADFNFGSPTDVIVPGSHTGTAVADITTIRGVGGQFQWTTRDGATGVGQPVVLFGVSGTDYSLCGDYDGDGVDDYAVWHPSAVLGESKFQIRLSVPPNSTLNVPMGANGDTPMAHSRPY